MARLALCAVLLCAACAWTACLGASPPLLLSTYTPCAAGFTTELWAVDQTTAQATLVSNNLQPVFPTPVPVRPDDSVADVLRRDDTCWVDSLEAVYGFHQLPPTQAALNNYSAELEEQREHQHRHRHEHRRHHKGRRHDHERRPGRHHRRLRHHWHHREVPLPPPSGTDMWSYSLPNAAATLVLPLDYGLSCIQYDPVFDLMFGLSSVQRPDGQWNVTMMTIEYNGDVYNDGPLTFYSVLLPDPAEPYLEDPARPPCAYNSALAQFSFHWPATGSSPGQLITVAVAFENFAPAGTLVAQLLWPPAAAGDLTAVSALGWTAAQPNTLQFVFTSNSAQWACCMGNDAQKGYVQICSSALYGSLNASDASSTLFQCFQDIGFFASPRLLAGGDYMLLVEFTSPWRFAQLGATGGLQGVVTFPDGAAGRLVGGVFRPSQPWQQRQSLQERKPLALPASSAEIVDSEQQ